jgi:hypothetical protein
MANIKKHTLVPVTSEEAFAEAHRFLKNAKETISKSPIEHNRYQDTKYVREASGIAYLSALRAFDAYLLKKGIHYDHLPKSYEAYWAAKEKHIPLNGKLSDAFGLVYENLHLFGYYQGASSVDLIKVGFERCKMIIEMLEKLK